MSVVSMTIDPRFNRADVCTLCGKQFPIAMQVYVEDIGDVFACSECVMTMILSETRKRKEAQK